MADLKVEKIQLHVPTLDEVADGKKMAAKFKRC